MQPLTPAVRVTVLLFAVLVGISVVVGALLWHLLLDPRPGHGRPARHARRAGLRRVARRVVVRVVLVLVAVGVLG